MNHKVLSTIAKVWCKSILFDSIKIQDTNGLLTRAEMESVMLVSLEIASGLTDLPIRKTLQDIVKEHKKASDDSKKEYLPEVCIGQKYMVDEKIYILFDIRATNVDSPTDFTISCRFKAGDGSFFEERIQKVISDPEIKLVKE